ncbi:SGNH/GDSL hydrolase family protein [Pontiellaceae bacterium B12227]|nr:SGNH/GDSL hydrolase family protein [Pontiellaceae bacterium B12227]
MEWIMAFIFAFAEQADAALQTMEDESVVFCSDLQPRSAQLLFAPVDVLSVKRANGTQTFEEGIDYSVGADGLITLTPDSDIPVLDYYAREKDDTFYRFTDAGGAVFYSPGGVWKHNAYDVVVTYTHTNSLAALMEDVWSSKLTVALSRMQAQIPLNVTFYGDSITVGAQASSLGTGAEPFAPSYPMRVVDDLKARYGYDQIHYTNLAVGGKMSSWGLENIQQVIDTDPNLVVLAFGMNDSSQSVPTADYKENTELMIEALRIANPNVSIVLVAEFSPNPDFVNANYALRAQARNALFELYSAYDNIAFVDVGAVSRPIVERKKFQDISGNNINHPNDFMHRIYADVVRNVFSIEATGPIPELETKVTDNCTNVVGGQPDANFDGREHMGVRGALASTSAQYGLMEFGLPSHPVLDARLRLKSYSAATPSAWGTNANVKVQVMVMSSNNAAFAESSATFNSQSDGTPWKNSANADAPLFNARDSGVTSTLTTFGPDGNWLDSTWYDIALESRTIDALEALREAGPTNALFYIQVKNDALDDDGSGVRFYSDDSAYAPQLVMELEAGE